MTRRRRRRFAALSAWAVVLGLVTASVAAADPFPAWSGTKGAFSWQARRVACGVVGQRPSDIRAHTRWTKSPANGYVRLTFRRQIQNPDTSEWSTVQLERRSTKNTNLEGTRAILHWRQWFFPFADESGATSRHIVVFEWYRDRPGASPDPRALQRKRTFKPCVVTG